VLPIRNAAIDAIANDHRRRSPTVDTDLPPLSEHTIP
jgi:hypothetical protein